MKLFKRRLSFSTDKRKQVPLADDPFEHEDRARFSDTSWQIHRTWMRNGDPLPLSPTPSRSLPAPVTAPPPAPSVSASVTLRSEQNGIYDTIT
ncbi:hypothetical protein SFRURICE_020876, partial [Spodoptera frugiperda]